MASTLKTKGIILKIKDTPGKDKLLFILTEKGILKGFMTPKKSAGKKSFTFDLFTLAEVVYFKTDSGNNLINSIIPEEYYYGIREDITRFYAAGYFASLALYTAESEDTDLVFLFNLLKTSFEKISAGDSIYKVKPVFELSITKLLGISPCLEAERKGNEYYFSMADGRLYLSPVPNSVYVLRSTVMLVYKILTSNVLFPEFEPDNNLYLLCEQYLLFQTERSFDTLKYLNGVIQ